MAGYKYPLPYIKLLPGELRGALKDIRIGDISLHNLILVLLSVLEFIPHVLRVYAEFTRSL